MREVLLELKPTEMSKNVATKHVHVNNSWLDNTGHIPGMKTKSDLYSSTKWKYRHCRKIAFVRKILRWNLTLIIR